MLLTKDLILKITSRPTNVLFLQVQDLNQDLPLHLAVISSWSPPI